jgi:hypothetical protein
MEMDVNLVFFFFFFFFFFLALVTELFLVLLSE